MKNNCCGAEQLINLLASYDVSGAEGIISWKRKA